MSRCSYKRETVLVVLASVCFYNIYTQRQNFLCYPCLFNFFDLLFLRFFFELIKIVFYVNVALIWCSVVKCRECIVVKCSKV